MLTEHNVLAHAVDRDRESDPWFADEHHKVVRNKEQKQKKDYQHTFYGREGT